MRLVVVTGVVTGIGQRRFVGVIMNVAVAGKSGVVVMTRICL